MLKSLILPQIWNVCHLRKCPCTSFPKLLCGKDLEIQFSAISMHFWMCSSSFKTISMVGFNLGRQKNTYDSECQSLVVFNFCYVCDDHFWLPWRIPFFTQSSSSNIYSIKWYWQISVENQFQNWRNTKHIKSKVVLTNVTENKNVVYDMNINNEYIVYFKTCFKLAGIRVGLMRT